MRLESFSNTIPNSRLSPTIYFISTLTDKLCHATTAECSHSPMSIDVNLSKLCFVHSLFLVLTFILVNLMAF